METKKNKKIDLESKRGIFFLTGLTIALLASVYIIQIESSSQIKIDGNFTSVATIDASDAIPVTFAPELEKPKVEAAKETKPESAIDFLDKFMEVDNKDKSELDLKVGAIVNKEVGIQNVDKPDEFDELEVITGNIGSLSWVAVPKECAGLRSNEKRKECLNDWMRQYIRKNAQYPSIERLMHVEERVYISFMIDEHGKVTSVEKARGDNQALVNEAMRIVKQMPDFEPATQGARKARMLMTIPVNFKLK